jgi:nifR3 family TIM-barrel protein
MAWRRPGFSRETRGVELTIGPLTLPTPVVLAPMAGVTNAPFRALCRRYGAGLYVNEMVMALAVVHKNPKTDKMISFGEDETPRSLQIYGTNPEQIAAAIHRLGSAGRVDHIDLNFGCPARKVTRHGGGAAVPVKRNLMRNILRASVKSAGEYGIPVTVKFRKGISDDLLTYLETGRIAEEEGVAAIALHARTAEQHYAGLADWNAIGELKAHVSSIPVLGNGDIWEASDAIRMMAETGCDGVVVGRGCLGKPWLFGDLAAVFEGKQPPPPPRLGEVMSIMAEHAVLLQEFTGSNHGVVEFRKHAGWYVTGYPIGGDMRRRLGMVSTLSELDDLLAEMDPTLELPPGGQRFTRGHTNGPIKVMLPDGYLNDRDDERPPSAADEMHASGGG